MNKEPSPCSTIRPLSGKVAIVTGSSRNIGAAIAEQLAADGADVVINYHGVDACASQIARGINSRKGGRAIFVKADVSTIEGGEHLLEECVRRLGVPDILVLNASVIGHRTLEEIDEDYYQLLMNTNVKGPLFLSQAAAKLMKPGSRIIFISSSLTRVSGILPIAMAFVMSKGAVEQIVRVLAKDLGQREITVNAIAAGVVDTPVFQDGKPPHVLKQIASLHPQNRVGTLNEISTAVAFLATKGASWINGQIIAIDGGFTV